SSTRVIAGVLLEFRLGDGETPLVKLVHGHEAPLNFVQVVLHDPTTLGSFETETDKDGHFSLEGIHDGTYVLDVLDSHLLVRVDRTSKKGALRLIDRPPFAGNCGGGVDIDPRS
ncbi:MAG TPA: hypothetical protein VE866_11450, partial [Candidatus Binatia bacterium]|nr:hypothetical protein [Candidatus Binatia bacterium]